MNPIPEYLKPAHEDRTHETSGMRGLSLTIGMTFAAALGTQPALAGPEGGQIVSGTGTITQTSATSTLITQGSERLGIDWQSFNVDANESVRFDQPSTSAVALNRIFDQNPSQILGALDANGHVYLINPNGIVFGKDAQINVGALVASSLDLSLEDFAAGKNEFVSNGAAGAIVNRGLIRAATGGSVTLLGGSVANEGLIVAELGQVTLAAGTRASLDFDGDGLLFFEVDGDLLANAAGADAAVSNSGTIQANGGNVLLTGRAAQGVFANVVNNEGLIRAARIENDGGVVRLVGAGAPVINAGVVDVSGGDADSTGGRIELLGEKVGVGAGASLLADGAAGGGTILVGGDVQGGGSTPTADFAYVGAGATLSADALAQGDGGTVVVWAEEVARVYGDLSARGGTAGGDGGFIETSGKGYLDFNGTANASAAAGAPGTWLLDPENIVITNAQANITQSGAGDPGPITFAPTVGDQPTTIAVANINAALNDGSNVEVRTTSNGEDVGDITVDAPIAKTDDQGGNDGSVLSLIADNDIIVNASITSNTNALHVNLVADGGINVNATIDSNGGVVNLQANESVVIDAPIAAGAGNIDINVDFDEATTNGAESLTIRSTLTATAIALNGGATAQDDSLIVELGAAQTAAWTVNASNGGTVEAGASDLATFSDFSTLIGGDQIDTFTVNGAGALAGTAQGMGNNDVFAVNNGLAAATFIGGAGNDVLTYAGSAGPVTVAVGDLNAIEEVTGSLSGEDQLQGTAGDDTFAVNTANAGTVAGGITFSSFENLAGLGGADTFNLNDDLTGATGAAGGDNDDTFNFADGATANVDGGAGTDAVSYAAATGPVTVAVSTLTAVETLTGSADGQDVLQGTAGDDTFTVNAQNEGTVAGIAFSSFENLEGLGGADAFNLNANLTGTSGAVGGAGADTFNLATGVTANVDGGADGDTLVADPAQATQFTVNAANAGTVTNGGGAITFAGVENLTGSGQADTFTFTAAGSLAGTASGLAGNDAFVVNNGLAPTSFVGGDGDDEVTYAGSAGPVTIAVAALNTIETLIGSANAQDVLQGTGGDDTFNVAAQNAGVVAGIAFSSFENLDGLGGADTFNLDANLTGTNGAVGGAGADTFNLAAGVTANVDGGADGDTLVADPGQATQFAVNAANAGTVVNGGGAITFVGVENLTGSGQPDAFIFTAAGSLAGTANGLAGDDLFVVDNGLAPTSFVGGDGTDEVTYGGSAGPVTISVAALNTIESVVGSANGQDILQGTAGGDTFDVNAVDAGTVAGVAFVSFENLDGLGGADTFNLNSNLTGALGAVGGAGADTFNLATGVSANVIGGADADTLVADPAQATQFAVNAANAGTVTNGGGAITFADVENLTGSGQADTFTFTAAGSLAGAASGLAGNDAFVVNNGLAPTSFVGGDGDDEVTYAGSAGPVTIAVTALNTIESVVGTANGEDVLQGTAGDDTFAVNAANEGTVAGIAFSSFENLEGLGGADTFNLNASLTGTNGAVGGAGDDTFNFADGAAANIDGGANIDTQSFAAVTGPVTIGVDALAADSIENVIGSTANGNDLLQGTAGDDTFTVNAANAGTVAGITFSSFENLDGLGGADTFNLNANLTGTNGAAGGAGNDTFNFTDGVTANIDGGADTDTQSFAAVTSPVTIGVDALLADSIENVIGSTASGADVLQGTAGADTFAVNAANAGTVTGITFSSFENLEGLGGADTFNLSAALMGTSGAAGGDGDDTFNFADGGSANVAGGAGTDTVSYAAATGPVTLAASDLNDDSIEVAVGSANGQDVLQGTAGNDTFNVTAANEGTVANVAFSSFENLEGLAGADTFNLNANLTGTNGAVGGDGADTFNLAANVSANLAGGAGSDTIVAAPAQATQFAVNAANAGSVTNGLGALTFAGVENLTGGAAADTFTFTSAGSLNGTASGLGNDDRFVINNGIGTTNLVGGDGNDEVTYAGSAGPITLAVTDLNTIESVVGSGSGEDVLQGTVGNDTFDVTAANEGTVANVAFSSFENLQGLAGADTFNLNADLTGTAGASGGDGDDRFNLADNVTASIDGGDGRDTQSLAALTGPVTVALDDLQDDSIEVVIGSASGEDVLQGTAAADAFATTAANAGTVATVTFSSFENLEGLAGNDEFTLNHALTGATGVDGGAGNDLFRLNASAATVLSGGAGNDVFAFADGVVASGVIDGGTGSDILDWSSYSTARGVTLTAAGADGFDGTDASATQGFRNIDELRGGSGADTLNGLANNAATWIVAGDTGNTYSANNATLAFSSFSSLRGGSAADLFSIQTGGHTGNFELMGNGGNDTAEVNGNFVVNGNLTLSGVETVANPGGGTITAGVLAIADATGGVGAGGAMRTSVNELTVLGSGAVNVIESNGLIVRDVESAGSVDITATAGSLTVDEVTSAGGSVALTANAGSVTVGNVTSGSGNVSVSAAGTSTINQIASGGGDIAVTVSVGDLIVGLLNAGPPADSSGDVTVTVESGSIVKAPSSITNVSGANASLSAPAGGIGTLSGLIRFEVSESGLIELHSELGANIDNQNLTRVSASGNVFDAVASATAAATGASTSSALQEVAAIDWAGLDPNVALVDCLQPCVRLPADQSEEEGLAQLLREATKVLLIRTRDGWKMIPVFPQATIAAL